MSEFFIYDDIGKHMVSQTGVIKNVWGETIEPYVSSSNMLYAPYTFDDGITRWKRLDLIIAHTFNRVPESLINVPLTVRHIDEDPFNINPDNLEWIEDIEEWKTADFLEGYYVSSWGRIRSPHNGIINGTIRDGYLVLTINHEPGSGKPRSIYQLHRVVAMLFIGDISGKVVNHIDCLRNNPRWDNLEIVTNGENNKHAIVTGAKGVGIEVYKLIDKYLYTNDGSIIKTVKNMHELGFTDITETIVQNRKNKLVNTGIKFAVRYVKKLDDPKIVKLLRDLLFKYDGKIMKVYDVVKHELPQITTRNIATVKTQLKHEGYTFKNGKLNRKISEEERRCLIHLLKTNEWSVAKTYKQLSNIPRFNHVSVYDIKYLKRKYGTS